MHADDRISISDSSITQVLVTTHAEAETPAMKRAGEKLQSSTEDQAQPVVKGVGVRIHKATVRNERNCIKIRQKGRLDKKDWVEINDILKVQGFNWLANGKDSWRIKMQNT